MPAQSAWSGDVIPVYVISLTDSDDRRETISRYLDFLKIPFEFVDAIDGRHGLPSEYEDQIDREAAIKKGRIMADVEFACSLSHMKTYQKIVDENIQWSLIMEDDAIPSYELIAYLEGRHFEDAQFTQLIYGMPTYVHRKGKRPVFGKYRSYLRSRAGKSPAAVGYIISYSAANFILENGFPISNIADWPDCVGKLVQDKEFRIVYPPLIYHPAERSGSILDRYGRKDNKEKRRFLGLYIPPMIHMKQSYARAPRKLFAKKLYNK